MEIKAAMKALGGVQEGIGEVRGRMENMKRLDRDIKGDF